MKGGHPYLSITRAVFTGLLVLLFSASCSKHDHDCAKPNNTPPPATNGNSRSGEFNGNHGSDAAKFEGGGSVTYRGGQFGGTGTGDGGGISDDGDNQSDGERSRHTKPHGN